MQSRTKPSMPMPSKRISVMARNSDDHHLSSDDEEDDDDIELGGDQDEFDEDDNVNNNDADSSLEAENRRRHRHGEQSGHSRGGPSYQHEQPQQQQLQHQYQQQFSNSSREDNGTPSNHSRNVRKTNQDGGANRQQSNSHGTDYLSHYGDRSNCKYKTRSRCTRVNFKFYSSPK